MLICCGSQSYMRPVLQEKCHTNKYVSNGKPGNRRRQTGRRKVETSIGKSNASTHLQCFVNLISRHISASQMHARLQSKLLMSGFDELSSGVCPSTTGTPGDIDKSRTQFSHALNASIEIGYSLGCKSTDDNVSFLCFMSPAWRSRT